MYTNKNTLNTQPSKYVFINVKGYKTLPIHNKDSKKEIGETRHYPPAIREWSNSIYAFNKGNVRDLFSKDKIANNIIKSYFNLVKKPLDSTKSKRMRDLIRRSSTKQLFISKSLIKQTSDKAIVNIFLFDRLKKRFNKRLLFLKNDLNKILNNNVTKRSIKQKQYRKAVSRYDVNFNTYPKLLALSFINKKQTLKTFFFYYFLRWALSAFKIHVNSVKRGDMLYHNNDVRMVHNSIWLLYTKKSNNTRFVKDNRGNTSIILDKNEYYKVIMYKGKHLIKELNIINDILYKYLYITILKTLPDKQDFYQVKNRIYLLFKYFKNTYYKTFIKKYLRKEYLAINYLYKLYLNKIKLNNLIPGLKYILSQIYNKKIELNLINLKYLHLNSDIFTNAIVIKLRKKTSKLLRVLRKSLKLVKIPEKMRADSISIDANKSFPVGGIVEPSKLYKGVNINNLYNIVDKSTLSSNKSLRDRLSSVLHKMFSDYSNDQSTSNIKNTSPLHSNILASVKYKWITGVRLEAKGRLTKRFTASRSLFKFKYKGNLKNLDYLNKSMNSTSISELGGGSTGLNRTPNLYMVRNQIKPNIQYTIASSKKRIGTFGIKGWISSN